MKAFFRYLLRFLFRLSLFLLFVAAAALFVLFAFEHEVPAWAIGRVASALSSDKFLVSVESASFRLPRSLSVRNVKMLDRAKKEATPFLSADRVDVKFTFSRLPWSPRNAVKDVTVWGLKFPRLPDGYYIPDSIEFPGQPDFREVDAPLEAELPVVSPFRLRLVRPDVLAVRPAVVDVARVWSSRKTFRMEDVALDWPDTDAAMSLDGEVTVDLSRQRIHGGVHGQARQPNIRPMLAALEITNSYQFIDAFTGVTTPVDATCKFDVNLRNNDLDIFLDLHPTGGAYRGVGLRDVHGTVDVRVFVRDTFQNAVITVGPLSANLADGRRLSGSVVYENTNDVGYVNFDCKTTTSLSNALDVANVLNDGTLDCLFIEDPGEITLKGVLAVNPAYAATNDLSGSIAFRAGSLFSIPLSDVFSLYALKGTDAIFSNAHASTRHGGAVEGSAVISMPGFREDAASFKVDIKAGRVPLVDLADVFNLDAGERTGSVSGSLSLEGPFGTNLVGRLTGGGDFVCENGRLAKFRFFSGFFDSLAKVPGLATLMHVTSDTASISMSKASGKFEIADGFLSLKDFRVEGGTFSIEGGGRYDMAKDDLDFDVLLRLKKDTILGMLTRPISWTLPNFFQFKIYGPLEKPNWRPSGPGWKDAIPTNPLD